jgi:quercetin dioxygenase-like cupin family protein
MRNVRTLSLIAVMALGLPLGAPAQDPTVVNPKTVHARLGNARTRVLESVLQPGEKEQMHSHPACVIYVITGGKVRNHAPDGSSTEGTLEPGQVIYRDAVTHWAENIGTTTVHLILVELKDPS